jgi:hypothetical protein
VYVHCTHDISGICLFFRVIDILGFGVWFWKILNFATCFGDIGIVIWILGNVILFGGFVLDFFGVIINGNFLG